MRCTAVRFRLRGFLTYQKNLQISRPYIYSAKFTTGHICVKTGHIYRFTGHIYRVTGHIYRFTGHIYTMIYHTLGGYTQNRK